MSILFYRRPDYTSKFTTPITSSECTRYVEQAKGSERAIPAGLSFEEVLNNKPLPPCSLGDFMDYLVYIEHSAENLQFYLWYRDYVRRWKALPESQRALSPRIRPDPVDHPTLVGQKGANMEGKPLPARPRIRSEGWDAKGTSFLFDDVDDGPDGTSFISASFERSMSPVNGDNSAQGGLKWQPFTIQPNREECNQIVSHYIALYSPRELNLSHRDRVLVLHDLQHTTHPSAFAPAVKVAEATLRGQLHPNFIRWSICNGNKPRIVAVRALGISNIAAGFIIACLLTASHASRWYRLLAAIPWLLGLSTIVASYKGLCIVLHHDHKRNLRPWELHRMSSSDVSLSAASTRPVTTLSSTDPGCFEDDFQSAARDDGSDPERGTGRHNGTLTPTTSSSIDSTFFFFGPKNSSSFEHEAWTRAYAQTPLLTKILRAKSVWTQDEALRLLQDRIVLGAHLWGLILTVPLTAAFVAIPCGNSI